MEGVEGSSEERGGEQWRWGGGNGVQDYLGGLEEESSEEGGEEEDGKRIGQSS